MIHKEIPIQVEGSQEYARLTTYIHNNYEGIELTMPPRPLVILCPGGGYQHLSQREAEIMATQFLAMGYHAAVLWYSVHPAKYPTALTELATAVLTVRQHAEEWYVNPEQIFVLGCSAGGHLAASMGTLWNERFLGEALGLKESEQRLLRPDGMILCYPVITSGEFAHRGSFKFLLGDKEAELGASLSLEDRVTDQTPPAFIWHTFEDGSVPVENSLLLATNLRRAGVPFELHIYPEGCHGLALGTRLTQVGTVDRQDEVNSWVSLVHTWIEKQFVKLD